MEAEAEAQAESVARVEIEVEIESDQTTFKNTFRLHDGEWTADLVDADGQEITGVKLLEHDFELREEVLGLEIDAELSNSSDGVNEQGEEVTYTTTYSRTEEGIVVAHSEQPRIPEVEAPDEAIETKGAQSEGGFSLTDQVADLVEHEEVGSFAMEYQVDGGELFPLCTDTTDGTKTDIAFSAGLSDEQREEHQAATTEAINGGTGSTEIRGLEGHTGSTEIYVISEYLKVGETSEGLPVVQVTSHLETRPIPEIPKEIENTKESSESAVQSDSPTGGGGIEVTQTPVEVPSASAHENVSPSSTEQSITTIIHQETDAVIAPAKPEIVNVAQSETVPATIDSAPPDQSVLSVATTLETPIDVAVEYSGFGKIETIISQPSVENVPVQAPTESLKQTPANTEAALNSTHTALLPSEQATGRMSEEHSIAPIESSMEHTSIVDIIPTEPTPAVIKIQNPSVTVGPHHVALEKVEVPVTTPIQTQITIESLPTQPDRYIAPEAPVKVGASEIVHIDEAKVRIELPNIAPVTVAERSASTSEPKSPISAPASEVVSVVEGIEMSIPAPAEVQAFPVMSSELRQVVEEMAVEPKRVVAQGDGPEQASAGSDTGPREDTGGVRSREGVSTAAPEEKVLPEVYEYTIETPPAVQTVKPVPKPTTKVRESWLSDFGASAQAEPDNTWRTSLDTAAQPAATLEQIPTSRGFVSADDNADSDDLEITFDAGAGSTSKRRPRRARTAAA